MKPFSDNLIFFDTEFSSLDPYEGEILSIGMVKGSGQELYLELEHEGGVSDWVKEHLIPMFREKKVTRAEAVKKIREFAGTDYPYLISYVNMFDASYLYKLLGINNQDRNKGLPYHWIILDFASVLFALGRDPESFQTGHPHSLAKELGIDAGQYRPHHALDDAKYLREVYLKFFARQESL